MYMYVQCIHWAKYVHLYIMCVYCNSISIASQGTCNSVLCPLHVHAFALLLSCTCTYCCNMSLQNFHTAVVEKGCHNTQNEPAPALETYTAALSGGPIGPSDHVLLANKTLIMATWYCSVQYVYMYMYVHDTQRTHCFTNADHTEKLAMYTRACINTEW